MNLPPTEYKRVSVENLIRFAETCLKTAGLRSDHAAQLAELLVNGDLRGVRSHGTRALTRYCETLRENGLNPNPDLKITKETDTAVLVDGDGGLGYAPMMLATDLAVAKAKKKGVAVGATCHIGHYGSAGHYVRRAMEDGCTAFSVQGSLQRFDRAPGEPKPSSAYWGNPPICFGLPSENEPPIILDTGTNFMLESTDEAMQEVFPGAFFKSMGLTAVSRILGGPLVGVNSPRPKDTNRKWPNICQGGLIVVIDLGIFAPPEEFRGAVDDLVSGIRENMAPVRGYEEATLPGAVEARNEGDYRRDGVPIGLVDLRQLHSLAGELGVEPPVEMG